MIIYNKYIPVKGFAAMAMYPFIFVRGNVSLSLETFNHEKIHFEQQKELWIIGFYLLYIYYWIRRGYRNIPFEREAYANSSNLAYLESRKKYFWKQYKKPYI